MKDVRVPDGFRLERLKRSHPRKDFLSGQLPVDHWLRTKALQNQEKRLSVTKVLLADSGSIAGYFTLATGQVDFSSLPIEIAKNLPHRLLPVAVLAWLGVATAFQGRGLGRLLLVPALRDCHDAGKTFAFVAVVLDCINEDAKRFYQQWEFAELPEQLFRLFLSSAQLDAMVETA